MRELTVSLHRAEIGKMLSWRGIMQKQLKHPVLWLLVTAVLWSLGGVLIKTVGMPGAAVAGLRSLVCAVVLLPFVLPVIKVPNRLEFATAVLYAATLFTFVIANKHTSAANAIVLQYSAPVYVALFSRVFLNEHVSKLNWLLISVAIAGISLFFLDQLSADGLYGNFVALLSGLSYALMILLLRKLKDAEPVLPVWYGNIIVFLFSMPASLTIPGASDALGILVLGALQIAAPYLIFSRVIKQVPAIDAVLILALEPILNPLWVFLVMEEIPGVFSLIGAALVIGSILLKGLMANRKADGYNEQIAV